MRCKFCGALNPDSAESCSVCLRKLDRIELKPSESFRTKGEFYTRVGSTIPERKTIIPFGAGAILIINGILAIGGLWLTNIFIGEFYPEASDAMTPVNLVFGGLAVFVVLGGVLAMLRRSWAVCLIASVASFFLALAFGLFCGIVQAMLGVAALLLIAQSRTEFRKQRAGT